MGMTNVPTDSWLYTRARMFVTFHARLDNRAYRFVAMTNAIHRDPIHKRETEIALAVENPPHERV